MEFARREWTRKEMLKLGAFGGAAALALPLGITLGTGQRVRDRLPSSQLPRPFQVPFVAPPVLRPERTDETTDYYQITMRVGGARILPDRPKTLIYGYNGITPGPTIRVRRGRRAVVRQINLLPERHPYLGYENTTSVHLHGNASLPEYDGWAEDLTRPRQFKDYVYPNDQSERTLWYHDHAIHHTAQNAYMGLAGMYITDERLGLPIPKGRYEAPLIIRDAIFARDGRLVYDDGGHHSLYGDVILVNGKPWPVMKVERRKYRFRVLNASVSRSYRLLLSTQEPMTVIGTDAGLMAAPQQVPNLRVGMAERYEIVIDFAKYRVGQKVTLKNLGPSNNENFPSTENIMRFDVVSNATDTSDNLIPDRLNPGGAPYDPMVLQETQALRTRTFDFDLHMGSDPAHDVWTINLWPDHGHQGWDPNRPDARPGLDDVEIWEFQNRYSRWFHPIHVHLIDFKVLDRRKILNPEEEPHEPLSFGEPKKPFAYEKGAKDVVYVGEKEKVRVIAKFGPRKGKYMMHCHNLVHEDHDMMTNFDVGSTGIDPAAVDPPKPISQMRSL